MSERFAKHRTVMTVIEAGKLVDTLVGMAELHTLPEFYSPAIEAWVVETFDCAASAVMMWSPSLQNIH